MHTASLPRSDRDEAPEPPAPAPAATKRQPIIKEVDPALHARVVKYLAGELFDWQKNLAGTHREVTKDSLAKEIGMSPATVHLYWKGTPTGDVEKLEKLLRGALRAAELRLLLGVPTTECEVANQVCDGLRTISRSGQIGFIFGEAGEGKTRGIEWFVSPNNPRGNTAALVITLSRWACDMRALGNMMLDAYGRNEWRTLVKSGYPPRLFDYLADRLRGSNRLLIVDNAHKLTRQAVEALCDFYDATANPIGLVGNPGLLEKFDENDQRFSRVGYRRSVKAKEREPMVKHLIQSIVPDAGEELDELAFNVATAKGHFRVLEKTLQLTVSIRGSKPAESWQQCFKSAHLHIKREEGAGN